MSREDYNQQLLDELAALRKRVAVLEESESKSRVLFQESLTQEKRRLQTLIERGGDAILIINRHRRITYCTPSLTPILGYSTEEMLTKTPPDLIHPEDLELVTNHSNRMHRNPGVRESGIYRYLHKNGSWRSLEVAGINLFEDPAIQGIVAHVRDITDKLRAEEELKRSEENFRHLAENIPEVFWLCTPDFRKTIYISPAYEKQWKRPVNLVLEDPHDWFEVIIEEDREQVRQAVERFFTQKAEAAVFPEYRIRLPDGSLRWISARAYPIKDESGVVIRVAGIAEDVTEKKLAEQEVRAALSEKEILLRELYHRVENNLQVLRSILHLPLAYSPQLSARELVNLLDQKIQTIALVHRKLYQSKDLSSIDLKTYIQELAQLLLKDVPGGSGRIRLETDLESVPSLIDVAIPCGLILNELFANSIKHAFPGDREGIIRLELKQVGNGRVALSFHDNGVGVPPDLDFRNQATLGMKTIFGIVEKQLQGKVRFGSANGVSCIIEFSNSSYTARI